MIVIGYLVAQIVYAAPTQRTERTLVPQTTDTYDLGSALLEWRNLYLQTLVVGGSGTSTFAGNVEIAGDAQVDGNLYAPITFTAGDTEITGNLIVENTLTASSMVATSTTATSTFAGGLTIDTSDFVVDPDAGRVGIGTTTPQKLLSLSAAANAGLTGNTIGGQAFHLFAGSVNTVLDFANTGDFVISTNDPENIYSGATGGATTIAHFGADGNVGIGLTNPSARLDVKSSGSNLDEISLTHSGNTVKIASLGQSGSHGSLVLRQNTSVIGTLLRTDGNASYIKLGNVGIGTSTPNATLNVHSGDGGAMIASGNADDLVVENSTHGGISILVPDGGDSNLYFGSPSDTVGALVSYRRNNDLLKIGTAGAGGEVAFLSANQSEAMRIDASGNVGIGTSSPSTTLFIEGTGYAGSGAPTIKLYNTTSGNIFGLNSSDGGLFQIYDATGGAAATRFVVDGDGNVGIGTSTPNQTLSVDGTAGVNVDSNPTNIDLAVNGRIGGELFASSYIEFPSTGGNAGTTIINSNNGIILQEAGTTVLHIDTSRNIGIGENDDLYVQNSTGNIGIGTTTPQQIFHVDSGASATTTVELGDVYSGTGKTCFNVAQADGSQASFYFTGGSIVVETSLCK